MRITIDISDHLHAAVMSAAARRGHCEISKVIIDALEQHLGRAAMQQRKLEEILAMRGSWSQAEANAARTRIAEVRRNWRD